MPLTPFYANAAPSLRPHEPETERTRGIGARIGNFVGRLKAEAAISTDEGAAISEDISMRHLSAATLSLEALRHVGSTDLRLAKPYTGSFKGQEPPTLDQSLPSSVAVQKYLRERHDMRGGRRPSQG